MVVARRTEAPSPRFYRTFFCLHLRWGDPVEGFCDNACMDTPDGSSIFSCFNGPTLTLPHAMMHPTRAWEKQTEREERRNL